MKFNIKNVAHFRFPEKTQFPKYDRQSKCIWTVLISRIILYLYHLVELVRIVLILKEEVEVFKKENGLDIGFKKGYLKISRSMSKSEFTEWIFHRCIHYFQVKYASPGCPIWHSIGIWKSHCSKISKWNHVFFSASKAANHLTSHQTFG